MHPVLDPSCAGDGWAGNGVSGGDSETDSRRSSKVDGLHAAACFHSARVARISHRSTAKDERADRQELVALGPGIVPLCRLEWVARDRS